MTATEEKKDSRRLRAEALIRRNWLAWFKYHGVIFPKKGTATGVPVDGKPLEPNVMQCEIQDCINWFKERELPIRVILLKPRTKGASTAVSAIGWHYLSEAPPGTVGRLMTGNDDQATPMFEMMDKYSRHDSFFKDNPSEVSISGGWAKWKNGNAFRHGTLGGKSAGVGGMHRFMWGTECALWDSPMDDNISDSAERWANALMSVPDDPGTIVFEESTARGASGVFYDRFSEAQPWEEVKKTGELTVDCKRISLFFPWFVFSTDLEVPTLSPEADAAFLENLRDEEVQYRAMVHRETGTLLNGTQMSWRRFMLADKCKGDPEKFARDYPHTAKDAFAKSGNPRFSRRGLSVLRQRLQTRAAPKYVNLTMQGLDPFSRKDRLTCDVVSTPQDATIWMYESALPGRRYFIVADMCEGKVTSGNKSPDNHGLGVFRAGFRDNQGVWQPTKLVAVCATMDGEKIICRWEPSYVEKILWKLSRYYGGNNLVPIIIERPVDCGLNRSLRDKGAVLYVQKRPNAIEEVESTEYGFVQSANTKLDIVGQLAQRVIENFSAEDGMTLDGGGIDIPDEFTIREMENFVTKPNGRVEAGIGHDDRVMMTAIAVACESCALPYAPPVGLVPQFELEDRRWLAKQQSGGGRQRW